MKPLLVRQIIPVSPQAFALGGAPLTFNVPRESLIDVINLWVEGTATAASGGNGTVDGLPKLVKSVTVSGSLAEGRIEPISGMTGPDLYETAQWHRGLLPHVFGAVSSSAKFRVNIPLYFREFFFSNEFKNLLPALPAWRMSDLTVTVTPGTQADMDVGVTPSFALSATNCGLEIFQYFRESVPANIQTIKAVWESTLDNNPATESPHEVKLNAGGDYTMIVLRPFNAANARQTQGAVSPITYPNGYVRLFELSRTVKFDTELGRLYAKNLEDVVDTPVNGNVAILFNRGGEHQIFQTGALGQSLNNVLLQYQTTNVANGAVRIIGRRLFDPNNLLGIQR